MWAMLRKCSIVLVALASLGGITGSRAQTPAEAIPPLLSNIGITEITATGATLTATSDRTASVVWMVFPAGIATPTAETLAACGGSHPPTQVVACGRGYLAAATTQNFVLDDLVGDTAYDLYLLAQADAGLASGISGPHGFTTAATPPPPEPAAVSLIIRGNDQLQFEGEIALSAFAVYADGREERVAVDWSSSDPAVATLSADGVLTAGSVGVDTPIKVTASLTLDKTTIAADIEILVTATAAKLTGLWIDGNPSLQAGGELLLTAFATYADQSMREVMPDKWTVSDADLAWVDERGYLIAGQVSVSTELTVYARYTEGNADAEANIRILINATPATLLGLTIIGAEGNLLANESLALEALGEYSDESRLAVPVVWSLSSTAATISPDGRLTALAVTEEASVLVTATHVKDGKTLVAEYQILILPIDQPVTEDFMQVEVEASGSRTNYSLAFWFNTEPDAALPRTVRSGRVRGLDRKLPRATAPRAYKLYVAARVPAGPLLSEPTFFVLNRSNIWETLSWPLAEFMSGVEENTWELIELIDSLDVSMISGTQFYVGYGVSDAEMLAAGRYKMVYQVP